MPGAAVINFTHGQRSMGNGNGARPRDVRGQPRQQHKPTAVVNPMGETVTPVPNFWAGNRRQHQLQRQGSKEPSPLAEAAQKIGVPAAAAQPPDPKNLPVPKFGKSNKDNFQKVWNKMQQPKEEAPKGEDLTDFLAALQVGSKPKPQQQQQQWPKVPQQDMKQNKPK